MSNASESASAVIRVDLQRLVDNAIDRQFALWPDMKESFSYEQLRHMRDDTRFHLEFIESALWFEEPALLDDYAVWCKTLFENLDLPLEWIEGSLRCVAETLDAALPVPQAEVARSYVENAVDKLHSASTETSSFILPGTPLGDLSERYLNTVLTGRRFDAIRMLRDAVDAGASVRDIYLDVLQPAQREIGRLWLVNELSVAQEHRVSSVTQVAMAQICERGFTGQRSDRILVVACVGTELHELGARMVADLFELDGWTTYYLGANTPRTAVVEAVRECSADVLALSATLASTVGEIAEVIQEIRADETLAGTKVLVGGYPFNVAPSLWRHVGADGHAPDAETATHVGAQLVAGLGQG